MEKEELVLSYLIDEQSKYIFTNRLEYNKTKDFDYISKIIDRYLPEYTNRIYYLNREIEIINYLEPDENIVIFGCGNNGCYVSELLHKSGMDTFSIVDNDTNIWGTEICGKRVQSPEDIKWESVDKVIVTPYKEDSLDFIHSQLTDYNISGEKIIFFCDFCAHTSDEQYWDKDIIKLAENEIFVDAGVWDLETSFQFINQCKVHGIRNYKVLAFEPDSISYEKCKNKIEENEVSQIELIHKGLWKYTTTLYFNQLSTEGSHITEKETDSSICVVSLDEYIDSRITYIKMDIEGAELEALKGAKEIIKRYKPKLAISVYHKDNDIIDIPLYIKELVPEYQLYMRHYSNNACETVLYGVIE